MNFRNLSMALVAASAMLVAAGCNISSNVRYTPYTYQNCYYDYYGYYYCDSYYYNGDGTQDTSRDMITDIAQAEEQMLQNQAKHFSTKFSLSEEQGLKLAKSINDFNAIQERSEQDVADFAQRLYGVSPSKIVAAAGKAQAGNAAEMNELVAEAAKNFNTTSENMKSIVQSLHGKLLEQQGIRF